jgi:alkyl sulfatase BDS1-like metallo-beta-lactamase superfamily hydrolase
MPNWKDATRFTEAADKALLNELSWDDTQDFEFASRGFIASLNEPVDLSRLVVA